MSASIERKGKNEAIVRDANESPEQKAQGLIDPRDADPQQ
jgi:hypothetical protein